MKEIQGVPGCYFKNITGYKFQLLNRVKVHWLVHRNALCMHVYGIYRRILMIWLNDILSLSVQNSFVQLNSDIIIVILYLWWVNEAACVLIVWSTHTVFNQIEIPGCIPVIV